MLTLENIRLYKILAIPLTYQSSFEKNVNFLNLFSKKNLPGVILNIIFFPAWFSIFASEMAKVMTLVCYKGWKWQKRVRACISSIFLLNHGILLHRQQRIEMRKREVLGGADSGYEEELMEIQRQSQENASLKSIIRGYIYDVC